MGISIGGSHQVRRGEVFSPLVKTGKNPFLDSKSKVSSVILSSTGKSEINKMLDLLKEARSDYRGLHAIRKTADGALSLSKVVKEFKGEKGNISVRSSASNNRKMNSVRDIDRGINTVEVSNLKKQYVDLLKSNSETKVDIEKLTRRIAEKENNISDLNHEKRVVSNIKSHISQVLSNLKNAPTLSNNRGFHHHIDNITKKLSDIEKKEDKINSKIEIIKEEINFIKDKKEKLNNKIINSENDFKNHSNKVTGEKYDQIKVLLNKNINLMSEIENKEKIVSEIKVVIDRLDGYIKKGSHRVRDLNKIDMEYLIPFYGLMKKGIKSKNLKMTVSQLKLDKTELSQVKYEMQKLMIDIIRAEKKLSTIDKDLIDTLMKNKI